MVKSRLRRLHNVNHFVVSQTNPHVIPFMTQKDPKESAGVLHASRELTCCRGRERSNSRTTGTAARCRGE